MRSIQTTPTSHRATPTAKMADSSQPTWSCSGGPVDCGAHNQITTTATGTKIAAASMMRFSQ